MEGNSLVDLEEAASKEEEERPVRRSSKVKRNASGSLRSWLVAVKDLHSTCVRSAEARQKLSSASLCEDDYLDTDEEVDDYAPPPSKKSPKAKSKCQTSSSTRPRYADDLMAQFQDFTTMGLGSNTRSGSPMYRDMPGVHSNLYFPTYGPAFSPSMGSYRYGVGMPGLTVNVGIGNINISTISNVGNVNGYRNCSFFKHLWGLPNMLIGPRSQRRGARN